jgi:hypothetical protein
MLRYFFMLDVAFAVLGASMAVGVGISALLLAVHLDIAPEQRDSMLNLLGLTVAYVAVTLTAVAGAWGIHRRARWHWLAQLTFFGAAAASGFVSVSLLAA